jgi:hypothetical protein
VLYRDCERGCVEQARYTLGDPGLARPDQAGSGLSGSQPGLARAQRLGGRGRLYPPGGGVLLADQRPVGSRHGVGRWRPAGRSVTPVLQATTRNRGS